MKDNKELKRKAGFIIVLVAVVELSFAFAFGGIWFNNQNFYQVNSETTQIEGAGLNSQINQTVDSDSLFANTYYKALEVLSEGIAFGTTWLEICPNSQVQIEDDVYVKICSNKYFNRQDIVDSVSKYVSKDYIEYLMEDNFIDYEGDLYIKPLSITKNEEYIEFSSYKLISKTNDKIVYSVKSKYGALNCGDKCNYTYKEHLFELVREGNNWLVSNFEMPY